MKYSRQKKLELLNSNLFEQPYDLADMEEDERDAYIAHQHVCHFYNNKHHDKVIDGMTVDIGTDLDWSGSGYRKRRNTKVEGTAWVEKFWAQHNKAVGDQAMAVDDLVIPTQRDGQPYNVETMSDKQKEMFSQLLTQS